ncbi:hypothetical protein [Algoriphagus sp.]|uniref:hypothetical protein n=1 Tax=Algoriphagus sp. TaxID=1872435 RepID=UPI003F6EB32B
MKTLLLLVFYSLGLFLVSYFLLDVEGMMVNAFVSQTEMICYRILFLDGNILNC